MRTRLFSVLVVGGGLLLTTSPVLAHHWFPRESDQTVLLTGTVTAVEWLNPHARFYLDVKDGTGKVTSFAVELGGPNALVRRGLNRDSLKIGNVVAVEAYLRKGQADTAVARFVQFPDGRKVFAGSDGVAP